MTTPSRRNLLVRDTVMVVLLVGAGILPHVLGSATPPSDLQHPPERFGGSLPLPLWTVALPLLGTAALLPRRRHPRVVLAVVVVLGAVGTVVTGQPGLVSLPIMVALFNLSLWTDRRTWLVATGAIAAVLVALLVAREPTAWPQSFGVLIWLALPPAIAEAVRNRRAYLAEVEERARRAEQNKEEEARRQVAEERIRIARELHDILAHSIAVINVQSGVAAHIIDRDVAQAKQALVHINDSSDAALRELRTTLDVLRQDGDPAAPTRPTPTLGDVEELLDGLRSSGVDVRLATAGDLADVPPEVGAVAYRVLQEALTNVLKHAHARVVDVRLEADGSTLTADVHDDGVGSSDPPPEGHGRLGIRERVHTLGGTVDDGPTLPGYRVSVRIPLAAVRQ